MYSYYLLKYEDDLEKQILSEAYNLQLRNLRVQTSIENGFCLIEYCI